MAYDLDLDTVTVNQELAIDGGRSYLEYAFCTVTRVTKTQIEVQKHNDDKTVAKFSKVTGRQLQAASWERHNYLVTAETARANLARKAAQQALQAERRTIKTEIINIADGAWNKESAAALRLLADRIEAWVE